LHRANPTVITKRNEAGVEIQVSNTRYHEACDRQWKFTREDDDGPLVCDVTDPEAVEIFLHDRNANTFYAVSPTDLTRADADNKPAKKAK
jgi:phosphoglucomutase